MTPARREALMKEYGEVATNFRTLTDIRFKLISYLPVISGAAVLVALAKGEVATVGMLGLSLFGLAVTLGLTTYNARNDQLYDELVGRAAAIERSLGLADGNFANRPRAWLTVRVAGEPWKIEHGAGIGIIYAASITLWLSLLLAALLELLRRAYLALDLPHFMVPDPLALVYVMAVVLAVALTSAGTRRIKKQVEKRSGEVRDNAVGAYKLALSCGAQAAFKNCELILQCAELADDPEKICARAKFYGGLDRRALRYYLPLGSKEVQASHVVALLTDLPPRWVFDCGEGRKG